MAADGNAGGMLNNFGSHPTITDCVFTDNISGGSGGAMQNADGAKFRPKENRALFPVLTHRFSEMSDNNPVTYRHVPDVHAS